MHQRGDRLEGVVLTGLLVGSVVYNTIRHPIKTYRLAVHKVSWYS